jgi:hypothetical protein
MSEITLYAISGLRGLSGSASIAVEQLPLSILFLEAAKRVHFVITSRPGMRHGGHKL